MLNECFKNSILCSAICVCVCVLAKTADILVRTALTLTLQRILDLCPNVCILYFIIILSNELRIETKRPSARENNEDRKN